MQRTRRKAPRGQGSSDSEGRRPRAIRLGPIGGKSVLAGRRANPMRVAVEAIRQHRNVRGYESHGLSGEAAERTLVAAMAERRILAGRAEIVDVRAERRGVAERGPEFGGDPCVIGAGERGR